MKNNSFGKYLITLKNNGFYAPTGRKYFAVWGDVKIIDDELVENLVLIDEFNNRTQFLQIGDDEKCVIIKTKDIDGIVKCNDKPHSGKITDVNNVNRDTHVWIAS